MSLLPKFTIKVCHGGACSRNFASDIKKKIDQNIKQSKKTDIDVVEVRCMGFCPSAPNVAVVNNDILDVKLYSNLNPSKVINDLQEVFS